MENQENKTVEMQESVNPSDGWKVIGILVLVIALGNVIGILAAQRLS